jgi:Peptidase family S58
LPCPSRTRGIGYGIQPLACPVVPAAILFDLLNGGNKDFAAAPPYARLGREALANAAERFALGNGGAGYGAICGRLKGGLGSASAVLEGFTVGALVAVNSYGSAVNPATGALWAAPFLRLSCEHRSRWSLIAFLDRGWVSLDNLRDGSERSFRSKLLGQKLGQAAGLEVKRTHDQWLTPPRWRRDDPPTASAAPHHHPYCNGGAPNSPTCSPVFPPMQIPRASTT